MDGEARGGAGSERRARGQARQGEAQQGAGAPPPAGLPSALQRAGSHPGDAPAAHGAPMRHRSLVGEAAVHARGGHGSRQALRGGQPGGARLLVAAREEAKGHRAAIVAKLGGPASRVARRAQRRARAQRRRPRVELSKVGDAAGGLEGWFSKQW